MSELDNLRPEVRGIVESVDDDFAFVGTAAISLSLDDWQQARAELLRLADENADYGKHAIEQYKRGVYWMDRAKEAEAELAALKARIAVAPIIHAEKTWRGTLFVNLSQRDVDLLDGKRVRMVVEE